MGSSVSSRATPVGVTAAAVGPTPVRQAPHEPFASKEGTPTQESCTGFSISLARQQPVQLGCPSAGTHTTTEVSTWSGAVSAQDATHAAARNSNSVDVLLGEYFASVVELHVANDAVTHTTQPTYRADGYDLTVPRENDDDGNEKRGMFRQLTSSLELDADTLLGNPTETSELIARAHSVVRCTSPLTSHSGRSSGARGRCSSSLNDDSACEMSDDTIPFSAEFEAFLRQIDDVDGVHSNAFTAAGGQGCRRYSRRSDGVLVFSPLSLISNSPLSRAASEKRNRLKMLGASPIRTHRVVSLSVSPFPYEDAFGGWENDAVESERDGDDENDVWSYEAAEGGYAPDEGVSHFAQRARKRPCY